MKALFLAVTLLMVAGCAHQNSQNAGIYCMICVGMEAPKNGEPTVQPLEEYANE